MTFDAGASPAAVNEVVQNVAYSNDNDLLENEQKVIDVDFYDGNGTSGTENVQGTGGELSATATITIQLTPSNDAPTLSQGTTLTTTEDVTSTATDFATELGDDFADPDGVSGNSLDGVAIAGYDDASKGDWQVSLDGSTWFALDPGSTLTPVVGTTVGTTNALLLPATAEVRFVPSADANTDGVAPAALPSLTVHAIEAEIPDGSTEPGPTAYTTDLASPVTYDVDGDTAVSRVSIDAVTVDLTIAARNDAPTSTASGSVESTYTYTNGVLDATLPESPVAGIGTDMVALLANPDVSDVDPGTTATLASDVFGAGSITVTLASRVDDDAFSLDGAPAGVAGTSGGSGTSGDFVVTLGATATFAQVDAVLAALRYRHTSDNPPIAARSFDVVLNDGDNLDADGDMAGGPSALSAAALSGSVTIGSQNDPPEIDATNEDPTFVETDVAKDATPVTLYAGSGVDTIQTGQGIVRIDVEVAGLQSGGSKSRLASDERLTLNGVELPLVDGTTGMTAGSGGAILSGTATITVSGGTATVSFVPDASMTTTETESLIDALAYRNVSEWPADGERTVTIALLQDDGGSSEGDDTSETGDTNASGEALLPGCVHGDRPICQRRADARGDPVGHVHGRGRRARIRERRLARRSGRLGSERWIADRRDRSRGRRGRCLPFGRRPLDRQWKRRQRGPQRRHARSLLRCGIRFHPNRNGQWRRRERSRSRLHLDRRDPRGRRGRDRAAPLREHEREPHLGRRRRRTIHPRDRQRWGKQRHRRQWSSVRRSDHRRGDRHAERRRRQRRADAHRSRCDVDEHLHPSRSGRRPR